MAPSSVQTGPIRFGPFVVDPASGELWRGESRLRVQDLPLRLLVALLERPAEVVTRAELTLRLWGTDTHVDAVAGLNTAVAKLREALDDDSDRPRFIETVPKRGYRFIGTLEDRAPAKRDRRISIRATIGAAIAVVAIVGAGIAFLRPAPVKSTRVAVVLFDNETGRPEVDRLAQALTDATVFALTAQSRLEVIGNATVLRTPRPFRELEKIRDAVRADYIVIGQVQTVDGAVHVRAHLIRAGDLAHVWVDNFPATAAGQAALQKEVSDRVRAAVMEQVTREGSTRRSTTSDGGTALAPV